MKKKTFTLIELIIVMSIVGLMFIMVKNIFTSENRIYYEGEICINNFYWQIKEIQQAALYSNIRPFSGISNVNNFRPDRYSIVFAQPRLDRNGGPIGKVDIRQVSGEALQSFANRTTNYTWTPTGIGQITTDSISSTAILLRGTGEVSKAFSSSLFGMDFGNNIFRLTYLPFGGPVTYLTGGWGTIGFARQPIKGCSIPEAFVSFYKPNSVPAEAGAPTFTVAFQNSYSEYPFKMKIMSSRESDYTYLDYSLTGSLNFYVCNKKVQCKETHRIFFDTRVNDMFLQKCAVYNSNRECTVWQWGDIN